MSPEEFAELVLETLHVLYDTRDQLQAVAYSIDTQVLDDLDELIDRFEEHQE